MVGSPYLRTIFIVANCFALLDVGLQYSSSFVFDYKNIVHLDFVKIFLSIDIMYLKLTTPLRLSIMFRMFSKNGCAALITFIHN